MLQYEKNDVSKGIDTNKTIASKNLCFAIIGTLKMLDLNSSHMFLKNYELKNIATLTVKRLNFRWILWGISTDEAVNRLNNFVLEAKGVL